MKNGLSERVQEMLRKGEIIPQHIIIQLLTYYESHPSRCVMEFHDEFELLINDIPQIPDTKTEKLRKKLLEEEYTELMTALEERNLPEILDGLLDLVYVAYGTAISYGLPMMAGMNAVQDSNMSKLGNDGKPIKRQDGKILKGSEFFPPMLNKLLEDCGMGDRLNKLSIDDYNTTGD